MKFSIIIVTYNRHKELLSCLDSITRCSVEMPFEVIVVFNGDRTYMEKFSTLYKNFSINYIHKTTPSNARNYGALKASGEYLFFLDDDCILPANYFSNLDFGSEWDVLGGPDQTPPIASSLQSVIGEALSSPLCMGPTFKRHTIKGGYSKNTSEKSLILCNLWFKASLFKSEGFRFNPELFRNEENFLLKELHAQNKILHYNPTLFVYHQRKENLEKLGSAVIKSGECRVQNLAMMPVKKELFYFLPLAWLIALLWTLFHPQSFILNYFLLYTALIALYYGVTYRSFSLRFVLLHYYILTTYSIGLIKGLWKFNGLLYSNLRLNRSFIKESRSK